MFRILNKHIFLISFAAIFLMAIAGTLLFTGLAQAYEPDVAGIKDSRMKPVLIIDDNNRFTGYSSGDSLDEVLSDLGINYYPEDIVKCIPDPALGIGSQISIKRATPVTIVDGQDKIVIRTFKKDVAQILKFKKISLDKHDKINYKLSAELFDGMKIVITRIAKKTLVKTEKIDYKSIEQEDNALEIGKSYVKQEGIKGEKELTYKITYKNGKEFSRRLAGEKITKKPQDEIIIIGTYRPSLGEGYASWYTYLPGTCAHRTLPFGTKIVVSYGSRSTTCTVMDRGPFVGGRIIDLSRDVFSRLASPGAGVIYVTLQKG